MAVDSLGNVYVTGYEYDSVVEWMAASSNLTTLVSTGVVESEGVAVDTAGNVYFTTDNDYSYSIMERMAASENVTTLVPSGLDTAAALALDGADNLYIADSEANAIKKWTVASNKLTTLVSSGLDQPTGVAVDAWGNVYVADTYHNAIKELPRAYVDPTPISEGLAAGSDALPVVLPAAENLLPPFALASDQSWLAITGITNDVVSFSFTANTGLSRTAHITLLGQSISITQAGVTPPILTSAQMQILANGACQFCFTNTIGASFTVLSTTDISLPLSNWTVVGTATTTEPGLFQFTTPPMTNDPQRFYTVRSP
jgi:hypothetical protein